MEILRKRERREIILKQTAYFGKILTNFGMEDSRPVPTPLVKGSVINSDVTEELDKNIPYRSAIGNLMYCMSCTRPDLAFPTSLLSRFMEKPDVKHWKAVKHVLRYLKGTQNVGLILGGSETVGVCGFSDADFAGDLDTRKSTSAYVFKIGKGTISWASKKQETVALSTTEAEYMAMARAVCEGIWLQRLLEELGHKIPKIIIFGDNQSSIALSKNPQYHPRTKHIDIKHHFIREKVEEGSVEIKYISTEKMVADLLTKAHGRVKHKELIQGLNLSVEDDQ